MKTKAKSKVKKNGKPAARALKPGGGKKGGEPMVEFTPDRSLPLTINGRTIEVHKDTPTKVPAHYKALYDSAV